jgi:hypothetical protein
MSRLGAVPQDCLSWALIICTPGQTEIQFYETQREAESAAEAELDDGGCDVYVCRINKQGRAP